MRHTALWSCTFLLDLFDLEVKGQAHGHVPTYEISLTYLERQKSYGPDKLR
jgi:hypothetical protein